jgi:hypothetical protein
MKRSHVFVLLVLVGLALLVGWRIWINDGIPLLTADICQRLGVPIPPGPFPQSSMFEAIGPNKSPAQVAERLAPIAPLIKRVKWVRGQSIDPERRFVAQVLGLRLRGGGTFELALVYYDGVLSDVDTPQYLGHTETIRDPAIERQYPRPGGS